MLWVGARESLAKVDTSRVTMTSLGPLLTSGGGSRLISAGHGVSD